MKDNVSLAELNAMAPADALAAVGGVFEHSPWIAERALERRPFASIDALHAAMMAVISEAGRDAGLTLLKAHPELAGARAREGALTAESTGEQASAGLDRIDDVAQSEFDNLNRAYREKFGFPFIIAVRNHTFEQILAAFRARLQASAEDERAEALAQVGEIARIRLSAILAPQGGSS